LALHKQLEATDSMEEAIQIAKKIRTAKRILFHDDHKPVRSNPPHLGDCIDTYLTTPSPPRPPDTGRGWCRAGCGA
jgi:hypothetical protein